MAQFDNITTQSDISNISLAAIADFVQAELIAKPKLTQTVLDLSSLVGPGEKSLAIPRFNSFVAERKIEAKSLVGQKLVSSPDTLNLNKPDAVYTIIENVAALQSRVGLQSLYGQRIAAALMKKWDAELFTVLAAGSTLSYAAGSALTKADFNAATKQMKTAEVDLDDGQGMFLAINPAAEKVVKELADFQDADKWFSGSEQIKQSGMIGKAYGYNIIVGTQYTSPVFYHKSAAAFAKQAELNFMQAPSPEDLGVKLSAWHLYGTVTLQGGVASVKMV